MQHFLPDNILGLMDLSNLEICKDCFIEKEMSDYYSVTLHRVMDNVSAETIKEIAEGALGVS